MVKRVAGATDEELEQLAALFRLLSDRTRLNLLMLLADGERNVTSLCEALKLPQPTVSHHLGLLRMSNVIGNRRDGKQVFYSLNGRVGVDDDGALDIGTHAFSVRIAAPMNKIGASASAVGATAGAHHA
jgi:DNA-binding transcriptional ArsR family regulator